MESLRQVQKSCNDFDPPHPSPPAPHRPGDPRSPRPPPPQCPPPGAGPRAPHHPRPPPPPVIHDPNPSFTFEFHAVFHARLYFHIDSAAERLVNEAALP